MAQVRDISASRILITYVTAGTGHRRAAEALAHALTTALPQADVECRDLLADVPEWLRWGYPHTYLFCVRRLPIVWGACYALLDLPIVFAIVQPLRRLWNQLMARRFIHRVTADPPDVVLTTHFFCADVIGACREAGHLTAPLIVVVTDLHPHYVWLSGHADAVIVGTDYGVMVAQRKGVPADRLHALGIPIARGFCLPTNRQALLEECGLSSARHTVLVTSGGTTVGPFEAVVEALLGLEERLPGRLQLLVVCGDNAKATARLTRRAEGCRMPVRVMGFIDNMPDVMGAADLLVTKAGGLTVTEALGRGLPLILYHVIAGQESMNASHVERHGAGVIARSPRRVAETVQALLEQPQRLSAMREAAASLSRHDAAEMIVQRIVLPLLEQRATQIE